jgi:hypothetical protein
METYSVNLLNRVATDFWSSEIDRISGLGLVLRLFSHTSAQDSRLLPPSVIPRESGDPEAGERENKGENPEKRAINQTPLIWIPAFAGMTKKRAGLGLNAQKLIRMTHHRFVQRTTFILITFQISVSHNESFLPLSRANQEIGGPGGTSSESSFPS